MKETLKNTVRTQTRAFCYHKLIVIAILNLCKTFCMKLRGEKFKIFLPFFVRLLVRIRHGVALTQPLTALDLVGQMYTFF